MSLVKGYAGESLRRAIECLTLDYLITWLLREADTFPGGITREQVEKMSPFQQIEFLEQLAADDDFAWGALKTPELSRQISLFVEEVDKRYFQTADDF